MHEKLLERISALIELSDDDISIVRRFFKPRTFEKGAHFLLAGDVCCEVVFINRGIFRFYINRDGEDLTYDFAAENQFASDYTSFLVAQPSTKNIEVLVTAETLVITHDDLQKLYREMREGERLGRFIAESIFVASIQQITSLYQDKPDERYRNFVRNYPHIEQRVPQYIIASYVGIKPQSLSRIRRRFLTAKKI